MRGRERQDWLIQLANREGAWPKRPGLKGRTSAFGRRWACLESARDDYARVISDRKWPLKKTPVIAHFKARSKHSFLTINSNDKKKKKKKSLIRPN